MRAIDAKRLEKKVRDVFKHNNTIPLGLMIRFIRMQPTIDVAPVVPARRVNVRELAGGFAGDWGFDCSVCGATLPESLPMCKMNCCPNCGAKFAQEDDENELC